MTQTKIEPRIEPRSWHDDAIRLAKDGWSWRGIAREIGIARTTVSDYMRKITRIGTSSTISHVPDRKSPRILMLDIETSPILGAVWKLWDNDIALNQIHSDWFILSYCAKWYGEDEIFYRDQRGLDDIEDDWEILKELYTLMNECDILCGHNLRRFDNKKINTRLILNGFKRPSPFRIIDTLEIAKRNFGFTSNKLEYLADKLCVKNKKSSHGKFPGYSLWKECLKGNPEAFQEMREYNEMDVITLEEIFTVLAPWDNRIPNLDIYDLGEFESDEWVEDGFVFSNVSKFQRYRNKITGQYKRGRVNLISKADKSKIMMNVVS